ATALLAMSNISFWHYQDYFAADSRLTPLLMTWTLGVEEQFYLFVPLIILIGFKLVKKNIVWVLGAITLASFLFSLWATWARPLTAYYLLAARAWELGIGVMLVACQTMYGHTVSLRVAASHVLREAMSILGLGMLMAAIFCFKESDPFPGFIALLPVMGTAL